MIQGSASNFCFLVSSHTTCCETIIVCWKIWSFQQEMHPHAEDSIAYGHPRSSKQCWEARNKPSLLVLLKELGHIFIYFYVRMLSLYLQVAKQNSCSILRAWEKSYSKVVGKKLEMPPCEDVFTIEQLPNCPLQIIALLNCAKVF